MIDNTPVRRRAFARTQSGRWHRVVGAVGGVIFLFLALTGVAVQHSSGLGLDHRMIRAPWLLALWGVQPTLLGIETRAGWVIADGEAIFPPAGERLLAHRLVAAVSLDGILVAADENQIWLLTESGDLLDHWDESVLPSSVLRLGVSGDRLFIETDTGSYAADDELTELTACTPPPTTRWSESPSKMPESVYSELASRGAGPGLSVERVLLDLHSGRAFGSLGPFLVDLAALALSLVVVTGLVGWWRRWEFDRKSRTAVDAILEARSAEDGLSPQEDSRNRDRRSA